MFKVFTVGAAGSVGCLAVTVCFVSVVSTVSFVFPVDGASTSLFLLHPDLHLNLVEFLMVLILYSLLEVLTEMFLLNDCQLF